ncbi:MAG: hypothetical protein ABSF97_06650 [Candidatus Sulfotelmatobacter sp.]
MESCVIHDNDFRGNIEFSLHTRPSFYRYSLWRTQTGEHLFDGAAGDLAEAMDTMRAHIDYLSGESSLAVRE